MTPQAKDIKKVILSYAPRKDAELVGLMVDKIYIYGKIDGIDALGKKYDKPDKN